VLDCVLGELPPQQVQRPVRRHDFGALLAVLGAMRTVILRPNRQRRSDAMSTRWRFWSAFVIV
jgi:hypothetical protein